MKIDEFITDLRKRHGVIITVDEKHNLKVNAAEGALNQGLIDRIRQRKQEIVTYFKMLLDQRFVPIPKAAEQDFYDLSPAQKRIYFTYQFDPTSTAYNMPQVVRLKGELGVDQLIKALNLLLNRHEILRTTFAMVDDLPKQCIHAALSLTPVFLEIEEAELRQVAKDFIRPFQLDEGPLIRVGLLQLSEQDHVIVMDIHHIISDGISQGILVHELMTLYQNQELPTLEVQYKDYVEWLYSEDQQESLDRQRTFWLSEFADTPVALSLDTDFHRKSQSQELAGAVTFALDAISTQQLRSLAKSSGASLFSVLLAIFNVLLAKLSNQDDITIGVPVGGRRHPQLDGLIGLFINTLPIRNYPKYAATFMQFLMAVKDKTVDCFENQTYPLEDLIDELGMERLGNRHPLFDVMFSFQDATTASSALTSLRMEQVEVDYVNTKFDLQLIVTEKKDGIEFKFEYARSLFRIETIERYVQYLSRFLAVIMTDPNIMLADLGLLSQGDQDLLLGTFNDTAHPYSSEATLVSLFAKQAVARGAAPALWMGDAAMSYGELDRRSNQIAHYLSEERGVKRGDLVGVMLERELDLLPVIFGILKAGAAYVPIDPAYPAARIGMIVEDSGVDLIISRSAFYADVELSVQWLEMDELVKGLSTQSAEALSVGLRSQDLAYVIFTSGSTGRPKGVMIEHGSVVNRLEWMQRQYPLSTSDVLLQKTPIVFDVSVWELFWWSLCGAQLSLLGPGEEKDPAAISAAIGRYGVSTIHFVPSMLSGFLSHLEGVGTGEELRSLSQVFCSGEALKPWQVDKFGSLLHQYHRSQLINLYGPTEATVDVSYYGCEFTGKTDLVPIGRPIQNTQLYIVGKDGQLLPPGVTGELCIGGVGLARGYINNEALTAERFEQLSSLGGQRIYHTGDLAYWQEDGNIVYQGRMDHQVKIRGYRIELGEIEHQLLAHPAIEDVVLICEETNNDQYLVAYYVAERSMDVAEITAFLRTRLPDYMVPSFIVYLEEMPVNANGKLDRKALPKFVRSKEREVAARTDKEQILVQVWKEVLDLDQVGIMDNFFSIGGDSIKAIQLSSRLRRLGFELTVKEIFSARNIASQALRMKELLVVSDQSPVEAVIPLTPIQHWYFEKSAVDHHHFNHAMLFNFPEGISEQEVYAIFTRLQSQHDALRMVFRRSGNEMLQENKGLDFPLFLSVHDVRNAVDLPSEIERISNQIQASIDLEEGPLMKLGLFYTKEGSRLLIVIHHLIIDGVSWRILLEDIDLLYQQMRAGKSLSLPLKTDSYLVWSQRLTAFAQSSAHQKAKAYWSYLSTIETAPLPLDYNSTDNRYLCMESESFSFSRSVTKQLLSDIHNAFRTETKDILLAAFVLSYYRMFAQDTVLIDLESHGREEIDSNINITRTIGWFTSIYPVLLQVQEVDLALLIKRVKEGLRKVPHLGIDYQISKYLDAAHTPQMLTNHDSAQISFNYLGQMELDEKSHAFQMAHEPTGHNASPRKNRMHYWEVSGMVLNEELRMSIAYSNKQFKTATMVSFMELYKRSLLELIAFCQSNPRHSLSPSDLRFKDLTIEQCDRLQENCQVEDIYGLSPMQEGLLVHYLLSPNSEHYLMQLSFKLSGDLDVKAVEQSINDVVKRYDILRTNFLPDDFKVPVQVVQYDRKISVAYEDVTHLNGSSSAYVEDYMRADRSRPFDLQRDVLMRVHVLKTAEREYTFLWTYHHIVMDGWCVELLINDFYSLYVKNRFGEPIDLDEAIPFGSYIDWLSKQNYQASSAFWQEYLKGLRQPTSLPMQQGVVKADLPFLQAFHSVTLKKSITAGLEELQIGHQVTMNSVLNALWGILLCRYNATDDAVFGSIVSGRPAEVAGIEKMIGLFINAIPVRIQYNGAAKFSDFLQLIQQQATESAEYQYQPLSEIQTFCQLNPLFDHAIVLENYPLNDRLDGTLKNNDFEVTDFQMAEKNHYDLTLFVFPGEQLHIRFVFNSNRFESALVQQAANHLVYLLEQVVSQPHILLNDLQLLTPTERRATYQPLLNANDSPNPSISNTLIPASFHQERLWFIDEFEANYLYEGGPIYHNIPLIIAFDHLPDTGLLERSIQLLLDNHNVLQTGVISENHLLYQRINKQQNFSLQVEHLSTDTDAEDTLLHTIISKPFRLEESLLRATLIVGQSNEAKLVLVIHHLAVDRRSVDLLAKELISNYQSLKKGDPPANTKTAIQYADFAVWQQTSLMQQEFYLLNYWKKKLRTVKALEIPTDRPRAAIHKFKGAVQRFIISEAITARIEECSAQMAIAPATFFMAVFKVLLHKYAQHEEIVIGTSCKNREIPQLEKVIGPIANLVVIKSHLHPTLTFRDYLLQLSADFTEAQAHQAMPFDKLVKELAPKKDMSRTAFFDVLFEFVEQLDLLYMEAEEEIRVLPNNFGYGKYDLNLLLGQGSKVIEGMLVYNELYFNASTIQTMTDQYVYLVEQLLMDTQRQIKDINPLSPVEQAALVSLLYEEDVSFPLNKTIVDLFEAQVRMQPTAIAIKFGTEELTYGDLELRSNQVAQWIIEHGFCQMPDEIVALVVERSLDTIIGILGILKAGGAYLPIETSMPEERKKYILQDSKAQVILTTSRIQPLVEGYDIPCLLLEDALENEAESASKERRRAVARDLCYIIYTSGTTGYPKGVMVEHQNVVRLLFNDQFQFDFNTSDVWTMFHSHSFDFSVWEIFGALLYGGKLIVVAPWLAKDTFAFRDLLIKEEVTVLNQTPSAFYNLAELEGAHAEPELSLRYVIFGGEALSPVKLADWHARYPKIKLINMYGITETTVHVTFKAFDASDIDRNVSNIGRPIPTLSAYILDPNQQLVPRGATGELYIGGLGLSRGYLGRDDLTSERFVVNPFIPTERLYRTGDLARLLDTNELEYRGRIDKQVQLRGFRIELGEIENQLGKHEEIHQLVVLARQTETDHCLIAYYTADQALSKYLLREYLLQFLPDYMVPSYFVFLDELPLTENGKVDKKVLSDLEVMQTEEVQLAVNATEEALSAIFANLLNLNTEKIDRSDSFFVLGGHSIRAVHLINEIQKSFSVKVQLSEIFQNPSVKELAQHIDAREQEQCRQIDGIGQQPQYATSSAQARMYFEYLQQTQGLAYNISRVYKIKGEFDQARFNSAVHALVERHPGLRTSFHLGEEGPLQKIHPSVRPNVDIIHGDAYASVEAACSAFVRPFDLSEPSLIRFGLMIYPDRTLILLVDVHHIVCDGIALNVLMNDFKQLYQGEDLAPLQVRYVDYAHWQNSLMANMSHEVKYWKQKLSGRWPVLNLPRLQPKEEQLDFSEAKVQQLSIEGKEYDAIKKRCADENVSEFMFLLSVYYLLLGKVTNSNDIVIGTDAVGRTSFQLDQVVGTFINILPLRLVLDEKESYQDFLKRVKKTVLEAFEYQNLPFDQMISLLEPDALNLDQSFVDVHFAFANYLESKSEIDGLEFEALAVESHLTTQYECKLEVIEAKDKFKVFFIYSSLLYDTQIIEILSTYYYNILLTVVKDSQIPVHCIELDEVAHYA